MKSKESFDLKFLIGKGHNLCENIWEYTEGQIYFMQLVEYPELLETETNKEPEFLEINNEMSNEEIFETLKQWRV